MWLWQNCITSSIWELCSLPWIIGSPWDLTCLQLISGTNRFILVRSWQGSKTQNLQHSYILGRCQTWVDSLQTKLGFKDVMIPRSHGLEKMTNSHVHKTWQHKKPEVVSLLRLKTKFTCIDNLIVSDHITLTNLLHSIYLELCSPTLFISL